MLGHIEILGALGAGGMGEVYVARDRHVGRNVAVKKCLAWLEKYQGSVEQ